MGFGRLHLDSCREPFLTALGMGGEWAAGTAIVVETWPDENRAKAPGILPSDGAVGFFLSATFNLTLEKTYGWRGLFLIGILPAFVALFARWWVKEPDRWTHAQKQHTIPPSLSQRFLKDTYGEGPWWVRPEPSWRYLAVGVRRTGPQHSSVSCPIWRDRILPPSRDTSPSRLLKKSASFVLASLRGSTYRSVRLASSLAAALLDSLFEHPAGASTINIPTISGPCRAKTEFFSKLLGHLSARTLSDQTSCHRRRGLLPPGT